MSELGSPQDLLISQPTRSALRTRTNEDRLRQSVAEIVQAQAKVGSMSSRRRIRKVRLGNYALGRISASRSARSDVSAVWLGGSLQVRRIHGKEFPRGITGTPGHACVGPIGTGIEEHRRDVATSRRPSGRRRRRSLLTDVAPASVGYTRMIYSNDELCVRDANALREEYVAIVDAGFFCVGGPDGA